MIIKHNLFRFSIVRKDEIAVAALLLVLSFVLNVLYIRKFYGVYCPIISGYDPYLLSTLTNWLHSPYLNSNSIYSHPGFGILLAPFSAINYMLSSIVGSNCADYILSVILTMMFVTEAILLKRILNEYVGLNLSLSRLLSLQFCGMAYVLLMAFTPDHFAFSQFFLIMYVYLWANNHNNDRNENKLSIVTLCVGCITITNGIKIILSQLLFKHKHFIRNLLLNAIVWPVMILVSMFLTKDVVYSTNSGEMAYLEQEYKSSVNYDHYYDDITEMEKKCIMLDSTRCEKNRQDAFAEINASYSSSDGDNLINKIKTIYWGYRYWIKSDVSRSNSLINDMFGESILFHANCLNLQNVCRGYYTIPWKNIFNVLFIIMVLCGIVLSRRAKLMQLLLCFLFIDIFIHLLCGFGISETYIYSPHYLFIFVISIGYLINSSLKINISA